MKNTYLKKVTVACVATLAFIGIHNPTAEAITKYQMVKVDSLAEIGQAYGPIMYEMKQEDNQYNGEKEFILNKPDLVEVPSAEPEAAATANSEPQADEQTAEPEAATPISSEPQADESEVVTSETAAAPATPAVSLSNEEKDLFARLVEAEAKGESYEGKVAVAIVVLNRVDSPDFPNTVNDVIHEVVGNAYAFSPVQNGAINKPASEDAIRAVEEALTRQDRLNGSVYFYNPEIATDTWITTRETVKTIGNHVFAK
ncbi:cell wall hydrolase [Neobacillus sp. DY30]|uniref:cell wall hydrolase n=1 Tax=Neobacillus sp. DY30 TaxID=3047871 RepID=UPI0024C04E85|nr:cell wall hydrolase [Neobacillus sp. DY30]WHX98180.1 cell wall hydrolase [Neobacillus sp. DY30]